MVRTPEVAGYAHPARQHTSVCHHTHIVGSGTDGILLHDSGQPLWFPRQRRSVLPVPTEDYTGGHNPRGLHHLHSNMLPGRIPALEPPRRLRVYDNGGVFRFSEVELGQPHSSLFESIITQALILARIGACLLIVIAYHQQYRHQSPYPIGTPKHNIPLPENAIFMTNMLACRYSLFHRAFQVVKYGE